MDDGRVPSGDAFQEEQGHFNSVKVKDKRQEGARGRRGCERNDESRVNPGQKELQRQITEAPRR